ncbi:gamma-glutamyltransferase [Desulfomarina sp.]
MSLYNKSIAASGHPLVSRAAAVILEQGGNAFDAVVAAGFAAAVAEPALTSLGGGGLMLGHSEKYGQIFYDFFVDIPGKGRKKEIDPLDFFPVKVDFSGTTQVFNIGLGSVAVPGVLKGLLHIHRKLGYMELKDVVAPARQLALGHELNSQQAHFLEILSPIMSRTEQGVSLYGSAKTAIREGAMLVNLETAEFLEQICIEGDESFYEGELAAKMVLEMEQGGGLLTREDLSAYRVYEKKPLSVPYGRYLFLTAAEPSMGGTLIALALQLSSRCQLGETEWGSPSHLVRSVAVMKEVDRLRAEGIATPADLERFMENDERIAIADNNIRLFSRGTTHISIADNRGNCAAMTCSNGEGSGYFVPGTGIMLNNMMGEDDLHPQGFHAGVPGDRVFSMMSPSLLLDGNRVRLVIGSGGSKRIRTAICQVLQQVIDFHRPLQDAVDAPRLYLDEKCLQLEPGYDQFAVKALRKVVEVNLWQKQGVYFGGVHAVIPGVEGAGDPRRGGAVTVVDHS